MNIVHVLPSRAKEYGGPVSVAEAMVDESEKQGMSCWIYPISSESSSLVGLINLYKAILGADIIHIHGLWNINSTVSSLLCQFMKKPYVITPHGMLDKWALAQSRYKKILYGYLFEKRNLRRAAALHFLNAEELDEANSYGLSTKAFILPNGVFFEKYDGLPSNKNLICKYPNLDGKILILFLGRLHPKKGFDLLIPAFSKARILVPTLHLLIAGPDNEGYRDKIENLIENEGQLNAVTFIGMVTGDLKLQALSASDIFVLSSHQEGDSVAVKEAMACGLPVVITKACHFQEVEASSSGYVVESNINDLTNAIVKLSRDLNLRIEFGLNAKKLIRNKYTWKNIVNTLLIRYRELIATQS